MLLHDGGDHKDATIYLVRRILEEAKKRNFKAVRLDTLLGCPENNMPSGKGKSAAPDKDAPPQRTESAQERQPAAPETKAAKTKRRASDFTEQEASSSDTKAAAAQLSISSATQQQTTSHEAKAETAQRPAFHIHAPPKRHSPPEMR
jgi:hypothetical protein